MPNFKQGGRGFQMKGWSAFTKADLVAGTKDIEEAKSTAANAADITEAKDEVVGSATNLAKTLIEENNKKKNNSDNNNTDGV